MGSEKRDKLLTTTLKNISKLKWYMMVDGDITEYKSEDGKIVFRTVGTHGKVYKSVLTVNGRYYDSNEYFPEQIYYAIMDTNPIRISAEGKKVKSIVNKLSSKEEIARLEKQRVLQEKVEKENQLKNNLFSIDDYKVVYLKEDVVKINTCEKCSGELEESKKGIYDIQDIIRSLRVKECLNCKIGYVRTPIFYGISEDITNKMIPDEKSSEMIKMVSKYGIPFRKNSNNLEDMGKIYVVLGLDTCIYDRCKLNQVTANALILSKKGIENKNIPVGQCSVCNRNVITMSDYNKLRAKGSIVCDVFVKQIDIGPVNGKMGYYVAKTTQVASINALHNIRKQKKYKESVYKLCFSNYEDKIVRTTRGECVLDNTKLKDVTMRVDIIAPDGTIIEMEFPATCCSICGTVYVLESVYKKMRSYGVVQCRVVDVGNMYGEGEGKGFAEWNVESKLHIYGYNVSSNENLTESQRQCILYNVLANREMSRWEISNHLNFLISLNQYKHNFEHAVAKWQSDLEYINTIEYAELDVVKPSVVRVKRRIVKK